MSGIRQVPMDGRAALIRENLARGRRKLDAAAPLALDLAAVFLGVVHEGLYGRTAELAGDRGGDGRYRLKQLAGEKGLDMVDVCFLWLEAPEVVEAGLAAVLRLREVVVTRDPLGPARRDELLESLEAMRAQLDSVQAALRFSLRRGDKC